MKLDNYITNCSVTNFNVSDKQIEEFLIDLDKIFKKNNIVKIVNGNIEYEADKHLHINSSEIQVSSDDVK